MTVCNYCPQEIFWFKINGRFKAFNDSAGTSKHVCDEFKQSRKTLEQRVTTLEEKFEGLRNLTSKILSRLSKLEEGSAIE